MKSLFHSCIALAVLSVTFSAMAQVPLQYPEEKHLGNIRQLTFGGDNAEAYWSFDSKMLSFQSNNKKWGLGCDQIIYMPVTGLSLADGHQPSLISTGKWRTTCAFFMPDGVHPGRKSQQGHRSGGQKVFHVPVCGAETAR